jgi:tetratricopeptide (TPR) repeat protein
MDLAAALRSRPPAIVASSSFSARCSNREALNTIYRAHQEDDSSCPAWLLGDRLRRTLGDELPAKLEKAQHQGDNAALTSLTRMPIDLVLTTSMSHAWEQAFADHDKIVQSIAPGESPDYDYDAIVYHLFGRASAPSSLLLTGADFERARHETDVQSLLQSWWSSRVFVFLGFEVGDEELQRVLHNLLPPQSSGKHFAFIPSLSSIERTELEEQFGIHVLSDTENVVSELCEYLQAAKQTVRETADLDALVARASQDSNDPAVAKGFELLEHRLRQDGSYERLVDVHLARLSVAEEAAERQQILLETASLLEHKMLDVERAFHANLAAYRELPDKELWASLRRRAINNECKELMAGALVSSRPDLRQTDRSPALLLAVECYREVGDTSRAIEAIELASTTPENEAEVAALHRTLLEEAERWYELTRALERAAARASFNEDREKHLLAHAAILEDRLDEPWAAIECYQQALAINPSNDEALEAIERLFLHLHQVPALLDLLYDYGSRYSQAELHTKLWRLGEQCRSRGDFTGAVLCFDKLRDQEPSDEKLLEVLTELYGQLGETSSLVDILKAQVGTAKAGEERAELCEQLAKAHEELGNLEEAAEYWEWVSHDLPSSETAVAALERLYRKSQNGQSLLALYSRQRELAAGQDKAKWIMLMADVYQHQLSEPGPAIDLLNDMYRDQPNNADLGARILMLLKQAGRHGEAAALCDALAANEEGNKEATLRQHAARSWQQDDNMSKAIKSLEAGIKAAPGRADLHKELGEILHLEGENMRAAEEFDQASELSTGSESTKYALKAAHCFESLDATDRGIKVLEHRWHSGSEESVVAMELRRLYQSRGRHADLIKLLEKQSSGGGSEEQVEKLLAMADAHAALGQNEEEIEALQRALKIVPHPGVAKQLTEVALKHENYDAAAEACEALLACDVSPEEEAGAYCLLARRSFALKDRDKAMEYLDKARQRAPFDRRALNLLVEFSSDQPKGQLTYLQALLLDAPEHERADILIKIGDLCRDHLGEEEEARDAYQSALLLKPDDHLLLHRCLAIAIENSKWDESLEYLEHLIKTEDDVAVRARYRSTMAHLFEEELGELDVAIELLWQATKEAPKNQSILRRLATHLRTKEDWQGLLNCSSLLLAALRDDPEVTPAQHASAWIDLADLCSEHLDDRQTAICALEVAVGLQPKSIDFRDRLARLYQADKRYDGAIAQHQAILDLEPSLLPSYTALVRLYRSAGNESAALACEQAVSTMCGEKPKHIPIPARKKKVMAGEDMAALRHREDRFALGRLLALMTPFIAALARPRRRRGTFSGRKVLPKSHPMTIKIEELAEQLGVHSPIVYRQNDGGIEVAVERAGDQVIPVVIVGSALLETESAIKTTYQLCNALVGLRREYLAPVVQPQLKSLGHSLDAVFELVAADGASSVSKTAAAMDEILDRESFDRIKALVAKLDPDQLSGEVLVKRWIEVIRMSAGRVALWVVGDLLAALEAVEDSGVSGPEYEERRQDLIRVFCSPLVREDMRLKPTNPITRTPMEASSPGKPMGKSKSLRQNFRNIARTVTEEIRLDSL